MRENRRTAVVLLNLGGPDSLASVKPFLRNLFSDPAIIRLPGIFRKILARFISARRAPIAREIYAALGGKSPLYQLTCDQAIALEKKLVDEGEEAQVFVCMRYWHPMADQSAAEIAQYNPARVVLLPLYPQYSTATTASSFADWNRAAKKAELSCPVTRVCCYPAENHVIAAHVELLRKAYWKASQDEEARVLFSAHGLPKKIVDGGDPYVWQVEQTARTIVNVFAHHDLDWSICYQSRVGPLEWVGPSTEEEIRRAPRDGKSIVIVPVAFVSEHSETRYELDIEYAQLAKECGVKSYVRVPALGTTPDFIEGLARLYRDAIDRMENRGDTSCPAEGTRICPDSFSQCPCKKEAA